MIEHVSHAERNIKLTIAYDGHEFHGWQIQPGRQTVQGKVSDVLQRLTQEAPVLRGAGRTDAGVHAWGQVANFRTGSVLAPQEFKSALNALLPASIRIRDAMEVPADFDARRHACAKTYIYRMYRGEVVPPFLWRYVSHETYALDFGAMADAARRFEGEHDFSTFAASSGDEQVDRERTMTRRIDRSELVCCAGTGSGGPTAERVAEHAGNKFAQPAMAFESAGSGGPIVANAWDRTLLEPWAEEREEWVYVVTGRSFLRNMVRKIVGTLLEVGRGRLRADDIRRLLEQRDRALSGPTAPPKGLCLASVEYGSKPLP